MKIIQNYIARELIKSVVLVLLALLTLYSFFDLLIELKDVNSSSKIFYALAIVTLYTPMRIYELFPIAILIGALYALSTLAKNSEFTILRSSGLTTKKILFILFRFSLIAGLIVMFIGEIITPYSEKLSQQIKIENLKIGGRSMKSGIWLKDNNRFINIGKINNNLNVEQIRIWEFDQQYHLKEVIKAETAEIKDFWLLHNVNKTEFKNNYASVNRYDDLVVRATIPTNLLKIITIPPERISIWSLFEYIQHLDKNQQKSVREEIILWKRLIYPLSLAVMAFLALPFAYSHNRMSPVSLKIFFGVLIGTSFHLLNGLTANLGIINSWHSIFSAFLPSLIFLALAIGFLWWVEHR